MKTLVALLSAAVLSASTVAAHAAPVNPLNDGYVIAVNGQTLTTNNLVADANIGAPASSFIFSDGLDQYVFVEANVANAVGALSVTELCVRINLFGGCPASAVSISDANFGAISLSAEVNASLMAAAGANLGVVNFASNVDLGLNSATVAFVAPTGGGVGNSPVPEPGTLGMMATGLLGAAGTLRRKFLA